METEPKVAIIGAGPLGIELAIALKMCGIPYIQFDKGQAGQSIFNFPPLTRFFSSSDRIALAGMPLQTLDQQKALREEYLAYLRALIMRYELRIHSYEEVIDIKKNNDGLFKIISRMAAGKRVTQIPFVVIATGGTSKPRLLNVPGEDLPHVVCSMGEPHRYFQRSIAIVGGKNSAVESALRCQQAGAHVTLIVRKPEFAPKDIKYWLLPEFESRVQKGEIAVYFDAEVLEITADAVKVNIKDKKIQKKINADFVIKAIGFNADMTLLKELNVHLIGESGLPQFDEATMETNVEGVFVLGTVVGGSQKKFNVFIENTHVHVERIINALTMRLGLKNLYEIPSGESRAMRSDRLEE